MRSFFISGAVAKFFGAYFLGLLFIFYYGGGDTTNFFTDARIIYQAFERDTFYALELIFGDAEPSSDISGFVSRMFFFDDRPSYMVSRIAGFFGLFTGASYMGIATCFAFFSFLGSWALYRVIADCYPGLRKELGYAVFFIPSVLAWGSGLLKDSLTFGALNLVIYAFYYGVLKRENFLWNSVLLILSLWLIFSIKIYIILTLIPALAFWFYRYFTGSIKSPLIRIFIAPFFLLVMGGVGYYAVITLSAGTEYSPDAIAKELKITSEYLYKQSVDGGSAYIVGQMDGTFAGMLPLIPNAVFIAFFRPFIWESSKVLMIFSGAENFVFTLLVILAIFRAGPIKLFQTVRRESFVAMALFFSIPFGFFIGMASGNFGTLMRYKVPMVPLIAIVLVIIFYVNRKDIFRKRNRRKKKSRRGRRKGKTRRVYKRSSAPIRSNRQTSPASPKRKRRKPSRGGNRRSKKVKIPSSYRRKYRQG